MWLLSRIGWHNFGTCSANIKKFKLIKILRNVCFLKPIIGIPSKNYSQECVGNKLAYGLTKTYLCPGIVAVLLAVGGWIGGSVSRKGCWINLGF